MEFFLNGQKKTWSGDPSVSLLKYLREEAHCTAVKDGCSGQGTCGACTVVIQGRAQLACTTPLKKIEGARVETPEGMPKKIRKILAEAFVRRGGIQCGFCTPGILMRVYAFVQKTQNPTRAEIVKLLSPHLCRCTGYQKIIESIDEAVALFHGKKEAFSPPSGRVGSRLPKYDGEETALGDRPFVADLRVPGMKFGALRFSDHPRAKIRSIYTKKAEALPGVLRVFTASDIPGERNLGLIVPDWPLFLKEGEETRTIGDALAGVVAETEDLARQACALIEVQYEVLSPLTSPAEAMREEAPRIHASGNLLSRSEVGYGNVEEALSKSDFVVTGTFSTQRIEHAFLETEAALAKPWGVAGVEVYSQGQGVYEDRRQIARLLALPVKDINVIQVQNGGGFGGKEDLSVQGHAALYAYLLKQPVRIALTREESMRMHPKRHPFEMEYTLACDRAGKLTALKAEMVADTGAYASVGMKVLERAVGHAAGGYAVPAVSVKGVAVYTNNIPSGAMRGFGVNQATFAMESCMDMLCEKGGFDRWQFRYDNALTEGAKTVTGQVLKRGVGIRRCLEALKERFQAASPLAGIAVGIKNTGIGCGMPDIGKAKIVIESAEKIVIHHGWTEMGQGLHTVALQTLVEETGLPPSFIEVRVETQNETPCGMTTASRGTSLVGSSVKNAAQKLKQDLNEHALSELVGREYVGEWVCAWTTKVGAEPKKGLALETHYSYGYAAQMVILDETGVIRSVVAAHDAGKIINPNLFEGQIEGAVHMGLGYALSENFPMKDGFPLSFDLLKCGILRAREMPDVEVIGIEVTDPHGPYGAKGVGEIGLVPTAAAVANALYQFDRIRRFQLPIAGGKRHLPKSV